METRAICRANRSGFHLRPAHSRHSCCSRETERHRDRSQPGVLSLRSPNSSGWTFVARTVLRVLVALTLVFGFNSYSSGSAVAANCQFVLGFKTLHDLIPSKVG